MHQCFGAISGRRAAYAVDMGEDVEGQPGFGEERDAGGQARIAERIIARRDDERNARPSSCDDLGQPEPVEPSGKTDIREDDVDLLALGFQERQSLVGGPEIRDREAALLEQDHGVLAHEHLILDHDDEARGDLFVGSSHRHIACPRN
jgi:hypothetical protein